MSADDAQKSIRELNKKIHELNYIEPGKSGSLPSASDNPDKLWELAQKLKENIQTYEDETGSQSGLNPKAI